MLETIAILGAVAIIATLVEGGSDPDGDGGGQGAPPADDKPDDKPATPPSGDDLQAKIDAAVEARLARERSRSAKDIAAADRRAADAEARAKALEDAQLSESEKTARKLEEEQRRTAELQAQNKQAAQEALRARLLLEHGADLPPTFRNLVTGEDEESIAASIEEQRASLATMQTTERERLLTRLAGMTDEEICAEFGDAGKAYVEKRRTRPGSIGAPSNAPNQPPPGSAISQGLAQIQSQNLSPAQRDAALAKLLSGQ